MRKIFVLVSIVSLLLSGSIFAQSVADLEKALIGTWETEEVGSIYEQYKITFCRIAFNPDKTYQMELVVGGKEISYRGEWVIVDAKSKPYKYDLIHKTMRDKDGQYKDTIANKKVNVHNVGVFEIREGKLYSALFNKALFPRPDALEEGDIQIFKKVK